MQRNGQNPIKATGVFEKGGGASGGGHPLNRGGGIPRCPACGTEMPPKPGFRISALKCPKCGAAMTAKK